MMFKYVVPKPSRRSPVINRAYYQRTEGIRILLDGWIEECESLGLEECAIVNIGCGLLEALRKAKQSSTKLKYVDIDYPTLIVERLYMMRTQDTLFNLFPEDPSKDDVGEFVSDTYSCLGIDLRKLDLLQKGLEQAGIFMGGSRRMPILVVSEVVLAYLEADESDAVIKFFAKYPEATFILHEQCIPEFDVNEEEQNLHPFASTMFKHFERTMTPLKALREHQSLGDHRDRFQGLGWTSCDILNMNLFTDLIVMPTEHEHQRICDLEPFDEYDELYWIGSYYFMAVATTEPEKDASVPTRSPDVLRHIGLRTLLQDPKTQSEMHVDQACYVHSNTSKTHATSLRIPSMDIKWTERSPFPGLDINRRGHTISILGDEAYIFGGFGTDPSDHKEEQKIFQARGQQTRLGSTLRLHLIDGSVETLPYNENDPAPRMHHSVVTTLDESAIYLYGGRDGPTKVHNDVWRFAPEDGWEPLWRSKTIQEGDSSEPKGLFKHTANMMTIAGREMMVVFGGRLESGAANDQVWAFDLEEGQWGHFQWRRSDQRRAFRGIFSHSSVVIKGEQGQDDSLVVIGGIRGSDEKVLNTVWKVTLGVSEEDNDDEAHCWVEVGEIEIKALSTGELLKPIFGHTSVSVEEDRIWVVGGVSSPGLLRWQESMIEVRPKAGTFQRLRPQSFKELVMVGHATAVDHKRSRIIGVGGGGTCFGFGTWWDSPSWTIQL
ncbi:Leucine carboxyl methyltransferase 2 [Modicella reniformis]|uniref:tRNA wybutosine-synthesizing protein 4 n=1 Tax=Modicella reniformis TaxID=1440133 RepID=A0A9P6J475_9FUNG|nr:Leucine carboxyl methyltransferase 2 [Modicella reniformis]